MKNGPLFFVGIFGALALSWAGVVMGSSKQLRTIPQHFDSLENQHFPQKLNGIVAQGLDTYKSLGCASCHTQQVRRPGFGNDLVRGFGERQSVARDYLFQSNPPIGQLRRGPDLSNFAVRAAKDGMDRGKLLLHLYNGIDGMPSYAFLFEERKNEGHALPQALPVKSPAGTQVVPTPRAEALVTYLLNLRQDYVYPEATPAEPAVVEAPAAPAVATVEPAPQAKK
jgi:cytochrome c oxidase cbb3-type subunit 2